MTLRLDPSLFARTLKGQIFKMAGFNQILMGSDHLSTSWRRMAFNFAGQSAALQYVSPICSNSYESFKVRDVLQNAESTPISYGDGNIAQRLSSNLMTGQIWVMQFPVLAPSLSDIGSLDTIISSKVNAAIGNTNNRVDFDQCPYPVSTGSHLTHNLRLHEISKIDTKFIH